MSCTGIGVHGFDGEQYSEESHPDFRRPDDAFQVAFQPSPSWRGVSAVVVIVSTSLSSRCRNVPAVVIVAALTLRFRCYRPDVARHRRRRRRTDVTPLTSRVVVVASLPPVTVVILTFVLTLPIRRRPNVISSSFRLPTTLRDRDVFDPPLTLPWLTVS